MQVNASGTSFAPRLLSDGVSRADVRGIDCLNATHCAAAASLQYVAALSGDAAETYGPSKSAGWVLLSSDGGETWRVGGLCVLPAGSEPMYVYAVRYYSASVIVAHGLSGVCSTNDGGATWRDAFVYASGVSSVVYGGGTGGIALAPSPSGGTLLLRAISAESSLATANQVAFDSTLNLATGQLTPGANKVSGIWASTSFYLTCPVPGNHNVCFGAPTKLGGLTGQLYSTADGGSTYNEVTGLSYEPT